MPLISPSYIKEKWRHAGFQKYLKNTGWMFGGRISILAVSFFVNAYMARYLGPSNFGLLNYVFSFVGLFGFIASLGIESIANREIVKEYSNKNVIIGTSFYLKLLGSLFAIFTTITFAIFTTNDLVLLSLIIMYSLSYIFSAFNIIETYFQSQVSSKYPAIVSIIAGLISAILKIIIIFLGFGIIWLTAIYILESMIIAIGLLSFFYYNGHNIKDWVFKKEIAFILLKDSWPLMLSTIAWSIYMKIDQVMIKNMIGNESAGIYSVAAKLSEFWYFIPSMICASLFPAIINAKKISLKLYKERLTKLYSVMFYVSLGVAIITTIFAPIIITILFGSQYFGAITTLRIYTWAGISASITCALVYYLISENQTKKSALATIFGATLNILANILLIPKYGINGAAFASLLSYSFVTISILSFTSGVSQLSMILRGIALQFNKNR